MMNDDAHKSRLIGHQVSSHSQQALADTQTRRC